MCDVGSWQGRIKNFDNLWNKRQNDIISNEAISRGNLVGRVAASLFR